MTGPTSHFFVSQRLRLHYVDWGNRGAPPLVLVHGGRDHARSWDRVAEDLSRDYHVVAPDLRGHGDSAWAIGGLYHLAEFVIDLAQLVDALESEQVVLMGHSLGSAICSLYAGANPDRVSKLVCVEGIDLPEKVRELMNSLSPRERLSRAIESAQQQAARLPRRYPSIEAAAKRMREENSFLSDDLASHLTEHGVARNEDGTYSWKFDDYARGPKLFRIPEEEILEVLGYVTCPVLLIRGAASDTPDAEASGLRRQFQNATATVVEDAGHWVHHDRLDEVLKLTRGFLGVA